MPYPDNTSLSSAAGLSSGGTASPDITDTNGNVGIGTTTPRTRVDVWNGALSVTGTDTNGTAYVTSQGGTAFFGDNTIGNGLAVDLNGNVGVGTATPQAKLHVNGSLKLTGSGAGITFQDGSILSSANGLTSSSNGNVPVTSTGANGVMVGPSLVFNNTYVKNPAPQYATNGNYNYRIATLPPDDNNGRNHLHLLVTLNTSWGASGNTYFDVVMGNRGGFTCQYSARGAALNSSVRILAFKNTDTSVDVFLNFGPDVFQTGGYSVIENQEATVYATPANIAAPAGTLVFDTSSATYPPTTYTDFLGNVTVQGNVRLAPTKGASLTFSDNSVQTTAWNGTIGGQDYADTVAVSGHGKDYEPGDVLSIDSETDRTFRKVAEPYSRLVAGIYSTRPGLVGHLSAAQPGANEIPLAMAGIVPAKVSTENGAIRRGDLLVSSSTSGYAMKGTDSTLLVGAVIGKALGTLASGKGMIEMLVALQ